MIAVQAGSAASHAAVWPILVTVLLALLGISLTIWQLRIAVSGAKSAATASEAATEAATGAVRHLASNHLLVLTHQLRALEGELRDAVHDEDRAGIRRVLRGWRETASWTEGVLGSAPNIDDSLVPRLQASCTQASAAHDYVDQAEGSVRQGLGEVLHIIADVCDKVASIGGSLATGVGQSWETSSAIIKSQREMPLLHDDAIHAFEGKVACKEIWIFTPDLRKDLPRGGAGRSFYDVVRENVTKRQVIYRYLLRDDPQVRRRVEEEFIPLFSWRSRKRIQPHYLSDDQWNCLPYNDSDFGIYNPTHEPPDVTLKAYFALPGSGRAFWVELDDEIAKNWTARVSELLEVPCVAAPA